LSDESLFREVDEEVRQEQFKKLWARYGNAVIGLAILLIVAVAGYQGWRYWQQKQSESAGDSFFAAAELAAGDKADEALKAFATIDKTGFAELAKLREAAILAGDGKIEEAVKIYDSLAVSPAADQSLRDLAKMRAALVLADKASFADIEQRLKELAGPDSPWRHVAREIMASVQFRLKDYKGADQQVQAILGDPSSPAALSQRAQTMSQLLKPLLAAP
jgi:hypothetical protein